MTNPKRKLRVRARGSHLVQDNEAMLVGIRRFVGRKLVKLEVGVGGEPDVFGWIDTGETVTLPATHEYRHDLKHGCLWPADQATAAEAGVTFDPEFGGEETELPPSLAPATDSAKVV